jgi:hypothetical protein
MNKNLFRKICSAMVAGLILLSACQTKQSAVFSSQCSAPCWRNIEPGKTSMQDAMTLVKNFHDVDANTIATAGGPWYIFSNYIEFGLSSGEKVNIFMLDNVVAQIYFSIPKGSITFGMCVEVFGSPEYAMQVPVLGSGGTIFPSDAPHIWFDAISPSRGVVYGYDTFNAWTGPTFNLTSDTKVVELEFFDPQKYHQLLPNLISLDPPSEIENSLHPWKGYGDIRALYPQ